VGRGGTILWREGGFRLSSGHCVGAPLRGREIAAGDAEIATGEGELAVERLLRARRCDAGWRHGEVVVDAHATYIRCSRDNKI
jgi:hypothetical protein